MISSFHPYGDAGQDFHKGFNGEMRGSQRTARFMENSAINGKQRD